MDRRALKAIWGIIGGVLMVAGAYMQFGAGAAVFSCGLWLLLALIYEEVYSQ